MRRPIVSANHRYDPDYAPTVSAELVMVFAQASTLVEGGETGNALRGLVTHARNLHAILIEKLLAIEPEAMEWARGLANAAGIRLDDLEALSQWPNH